MPHLKNLFPEDREVIYRGAQSAVTQLAATLPGMITDPVAQVQITGDIQAIAKGLEVIDSALRELNNTTAQRAIDANLIATQANLIATQAIEITRKSATETKEAIDQLRTDLVKASERSDAVMKQITEQSDAIAKQANKLQAWGIGLSVAIGLLAIPIVLDAIAFLRNYLGF